MIELRWVVRKVKNLRPEANVYNGHPMEKVLQYRQWLIRLDAGGAITPTPLPIEWTEWEDVPTVSEE